MTALIEVRGLTKVYEQGESATIALKGVALSIDRGEFIAIIGPSGSGKSTLLQILGLLDPATAGTFLFDGKDVGSLTGDELAEIRNGTIGFVFQAFNLLPRTSVLENVKLPLGYSIIPRARWDILAQEKIARVHLEHRLAHEPSQLSGGEKQRVAIARALVCEPAVLFADEPTGNLDSKNGAAVMETLEELHEKEGTTVVLITHDKAIARRAHRIVAVKDGSIVYDGPSADYDESVIA